MDLSNMYTPRQAVKPTVGITPADGRLLPTRQRKDYRSKAVLTETGKKTSEEGQSADLARVLEGGRDITAKERDTFYRVLYLIPTIWRNSVKNWKSHREKITGRI